ncbi:hypothetical protein ACPA5B_12630 [Pseudomonas solani]|uniref:hypothetical protein n=1 Tax=Pseudomonas TaxID=286 RepID=UPI0021E0C465|nr:hypothetical protein [Pseudomonas sp. PDM13]MCU9948455.1 hypothetical protein [Pseudomonas sp. PDM13]
MEEIFGGVLRVLGWFLQSIIFDLIGWLLYWIGLPFMRLLTLGRYPRRGPNDNTESILTASLGLVIVVLVILWATGQL